MHENIPELILSKKWKIGYRGELFESAEIKEKAVKFAAGLRKLGIKKGDRIAILTKNRPEWVIADLVLLVMGAVYMSATP